MTTPPGPSSTIRVIDEEACDGSDDPSAGRSPRTVDELEDLAFELRSKLLHLCGTYEGAVHIGGDLSAADIFTALFEYGLHVDPTDLRNPDATASCSARDTPRSACTSRCRSRVLLVRGHRRDLRSARQRVRHASLQGAAARVECSTGRSVTVCQLAVGMALSARGRGESHRVVCLLGDGETGEGSVWEAAMAARSNELGNLVAFVDRNSPADDELRRGASRLRAVPRQVGSVRLERRAHRRPRHASAREGDR